MLQRGTGAAGISCRVGLHGAVRAGAGRWGAAAEMLGESSRVESLDPGGGMMEWVFVLVARWWNAQGLLPAAAAAPFTDTTPLATRRHDHHDPPQMPERVPAANGVLDRRLVRPCVCVCVRACVCVCVCVCACGEEIGEGMAKDPCGHMPCLGRGAFWRLHGHHGHCCMWDLECGWRRGRVEVPGEGRWGAIWSAPEGASICRG